MLRKFIRKFVLTQGGASERICFALPPRQSRFCTEEWQDDSYYFSSAVQEACRLARLCGLNEQTRFLDIGSGQGRMAIGLQAMFPRLRSYVGLDVHAASVRWCSANLARRNFVFRHVDTPNERYNPAGKGACALPVDDGAADLAFLYSVFTHMRLPDVERHLREISRVLASGGKCFLTVYVEEWPKPEEENPPGYLAELGESVGVLHRVVFDRHSFEQQCAQASLAVSKFMYRSESVTKQSTYVLTKL